ncbi:MAG: hypothetical protein ACRDDZ_01290 [Marinifilaceae bacterium]
MTIQEAILAFPGLEDADLYVTKVTVDRLVDESATYSPIDDKIKVNLCIADVCLAMANASDFTEGKLSIQRSKEFKNTAIRLYMENGEVAKAKALKVNTRGISRAW